MSNFSAADRFSHPFIREQRDHQAERRGNDSKTQDQVVEEGERGWSLPGLQFKSIFTSYLIFDYLLFTLSYTACVFRG